LRKYITKLRIAQSKLVFRMIRAIIYNMLLSDKKQLHIAFIVPQANRNTRRILTGINHYAAINPSWHLRLACGNPYNILLALSKSGINGVFISVQSEKVNSKLLAMKLPSVAVQCLKPPDGIPYLTSNSYGAGQIAAEYFIQHGFRNFAYYTLSNVMWSRERMRGFCEKIKENGYSTKVYNINAKGNLLKDWQIGQTWIKGIEKPVNWLKSLPKPIGLMACDDGAAYNLIEAATEAGIRVPEDIAIIGMDNDETLCNSITPPLSSIESNIEQAGFEAAKLLNNIIIGKEHMSFRAVFAPIVGVVTRRSSDILAIDDPQLEAALHFIRHNFNSMIQITDVVNVTTLSRRALEKKFRSVLKRSILDEIMRVRVEHIAELLLKSDMTISQITDTSTFYSSSHMIEVFKKFKGVTPRIFRKNNGII
jgi:LacI family transcriptional regulator